MLRIGHKGADAEVTGNTLASFERAVEIGVDMIEVDVLCDAEAPLVIAHDREDAARRGPTAGDAEIDPQRTLLTLGQCLEAFTRPPLDRVEINLDIKGLGREGEVIDAVRDHGLLERTMCSGLDLPAIDRVRAHDPEFRLGWTFPIVRNARERIWWIHPLVVPNVVWTRRMLPSRAARELEARDVHALWLHHSLFTPALLTATRQTSTALMTWTVDELDRIAALRAFGVDGICSNDPRLLNPPNVAEESP